MHQFRHCTATFPPFLPLGLENFNPMLKPLLICNRRSNSSLSQLCAECRGLCTTCVWCVQSGQSTHHSYQPSLSLALYLGDDWHSGGVAGLPSQTFIVTRGPGVVSSQDLPSTTWHSIMSKHAFAYELTNLWREFQPGWTSSDWTIHIVL